MKITDFTHSVQETLCYKIYLRKIEFCLAGKEYACNAGDAVLTAGSRRSPGEGIGYPFQYSWASLVAQVVKNLPAKQETWVQSLGQEDSLEKAMATHSSTLAWKIPWMEEPG